MAKKQNGTVRLNDILTVRPRKVETENIPIYSPEIKLDSFLKYAGIAETGGQAKAFIQEGRVRVNGTVCNVRGKKLKVGDVVRFHGTDYKIVEEITSVY